MNAPIGFPGKHGIDPGRPNWEEQLRSRDAKLFRELQLILSDRWNDHLDECHGACVLRRLDLDKDVAGTACCISIKTDMT